MHIYATDHRDTCIARRVVIPPTRTSLLSASCWRELSHITHLWHMHISTCTSLAPDVTKRVVIPRTKTSWWKCTYTQLITETHASQDETHRDTTDDILCFRKGHDSTGLNMFVISEFVTRRLKGRDTTDQNIFVISELLTRIITHHTSLTYAHLTLHISWAGCYRKGRDTTDFVTCRWKDRDTTDLNMFVIGEFVTWVVIPRTRTSWLSTNENVSGFVTCRLKGRDTTDQHILVIHERRRFRAGRCIRHVTHIHISTHHMSEDVFWPEGTIDRRTPKGTQITTKPRQQFLGRMLPKGSWYHEPKHLGDQRTKTHHHKNTKCYTYTHLNTSQERRRFRAGWYYRSQNAERYTNHHETSTSVLGPDVSERVVIPRTRTSRWSTNEDTSLQSSPPAPHHHHHTTMHNTTSPQSCETP